MELLSYQISSPCRLHFFGRQPILEWLPCLIGTINLRTTVTLAEIKEPLLVLNLPDVKFAFQYDMKKVTTTFLQNMPFFNNKYNWETPEFINMEDIEKKIEQFLSTSGNSGLTPEQIAAVKTFYFLYSGILSSFIMEMKPLTINVTTQAILHSQLDSFSSYSASLAGAFIQYIKCKCNEASTDKLVKKCCKTGNVKPSPNLDSFSDDEKALIRMWTSYAHFFRPTKKQNTGSGAYFSTYGYLANYSRSESWNPEENSLSDIKINVLLVETGISYNEPSENWKNTIIEKYQGLHHAVCELNSRSSSSALKYLREFGNLQKTGDKGNEKMNYALECVNELIFLSQKLIEGFNTKNERSEDILQIANKYKLKGRRLGFHEGGLVYILVHPNLGKDALKALREDYKKAGYKNHLLQAGVPGVTVSNMHAKKTYARV